MSQPRRNNFSYFYNKKIMEFNRTDFVNLILSKKMNLPVRYCIQIGITSNKPERKSYSDLVKDIYKYYKHITGAILKSNGIITYYKIFVKQCKDNEY